MLIPNLGEFSHSGIDFNAAIYSSNFSISNFTRLEETLRDIVENPKLPYAPKANMTQHHVLIYIFIIGLMFAIIFVGYKLSKIRMYVNKQIPKAIEMPKITVTEDDSNA